MTFFLSINFLQAFFLAQVKLPFSILTLNNQIKYECTSLHTKLFNHTIKIKNTKQTYNNSNHHPKPYNQTKKHLKKSQSK